MLCNLYVSILVESSFPGSDVFTMDKKRAIEFIVLLFLAVAFLTSYAAFGGTGSATTTVASTTTVPQTTYASGNANTVVIGYNYTLLATSVCTPNAIPAINAVKAAVAPLSDNDTLFYSSVNSSSILLALSQSGNMTGQQLYGYMAKNMGQAYFNCTKFYGGAIVTVPPTISLVINSQSYNLLVPASFRKGTVLQQLNSSPSNSISVRILALVTQNGSIYSMKLLKG